MKPRVEKSAIGGWVAYCPNGCYFILAETWREAYARATALSAHHSQEATC